MSHITLFITEDDGEWIVKYYRDGFYAEGPTYYTSDIDDAADTAQAMKTEAESQGHTAQIDFDPEIVGDYESFPYNRNPYRRNIDFPEQLQQLRQIGPPRILQFIQRKHEEAALYKKLLYKITQLPARILPMHRAMAKQLFKTHNWGVDVSFCLDHAHFLLVLPFKDDVSREQISDEISERLFSNLAAISQQIISELVDNEVVIEEQRIDEDEEMGLVLVFEFSSEV